MEPANWLTPLDLDVLLIAYEDSPHFQAIKAYILSKAEAGAHLFSIFAFSPLPSLNLRRKSSLFPAFSVTPKEPRSTFHPLTHIRER